MRKDIFCLAPSLPSSPALPLSHALPLPPPLGDFFLKRLPGVRRSWRSRILTVNFRNDNQQIKFRVTDGTEVHASNQFGFEASINSVKEKGENLCVIQFWL